MYLAVTVALIWLASTAVSSGVSHWATLSHKLWQRRDEQRPKAILALSFSHSLDPFSVLLFHYTTSLFLTPRPPELEQNSCKGKDSTPTAILGLSEHPSEGFTSFPDPVLFFYVRPLTSNFPAIRW